MSTRFKVQKLKFFAFFFFWFQVTNMFQFTYYSYLASTSFTMLYSVWWDIHMVLKRIVCNPKKTHIQIENKTNQRQILHIDDLKLKVNSF